MLQDGDEVISKEEWLQFFDPIPDHEVDEMKAWLSQQVRSFAVYTVLYTCYAHWLRTSRPQNYIVTRCLRPSAVVQARWVY